MSGHTPGPWRLSDDTDIGFYPAVQRGRSGGFEVRDSDKDRALADARLIAAAPELLEALLGMIVSYELEASPLNPALLKARAALAKATGGAE